MSRREIVVNTLLGAGLMLVFCGGLTVIGLGGILGLIGLDWVLQRFGPGVSLPAGFSIFVFFSFWMLWGAFHRAQKRQWISTFLFISVVPLVGFSWFTHIQTTLAGPGHTLLSWLPVMMVLAAAAEAVPSRLGFYLSAFVVAVATSVNSGLWGNGPVAQMVANCVVAVTFMWWIAIVWNRYKTVHSPKPLALPHPSA